MGSGKNSQARSPIKTINLELGMPTVHQALARLSSELALARQEGRDLLKFIHGYGSSGVGGEMRIAIQKQLCQMADGGQIRACIFGENWSKTDDATWRLLHLRPELKHDVDLGRRNAGITIVVL